MSALQADSEQRLIDYAARQEVAATRGDRAMWRKKLEEERRTLEMIKRVERLNSEMKEMRSE